MVATAASSLPVKSFPYGMPSRGASSAGVWVCEFHRGTAAEIMGQGTPVGIELILGISRSWGHNNAEVQP